MGNIRTTPQKTQEGQASGQVSLEITYGGKESPFGGIDSTAPPAYIAPNCFASSDGFYIVDNQLVLASLQPLTLPTLFSETTGVTLLKVGNFYNSNTGFLNYALGLTLQAIVGPPNGIIYTFYMTVWRYVNQVPTLVGNDTLVIKLFDTKQNPVAATLTLPVLMGQSSNFTDSGSLSLNYGASNVFAGSVSYGYTGGATIASVVAGMVIALNAISASSHFTASASIDGLSIILTATTPGAAGNNLQIADNSSDTTTPTNPPPFFFPTAGDLVNWTNLSGGADAITFSPPQNLGPVSAAEVGGTLYLANLGPMILKYSGPGKFFISSLYAGVKTLRKFAGSLIGLGNIPQLLNTVQNADMIFSWSAANNLDEWAPVTTSGNVTGAGFEQLADISDSLNGLIVSNNTAFILRQEGVSYATALGSGSLPFNVAHIGLGDEGEGAPDRRLVCQYNETGAFIGNTDVFKVSNGVASIGEKIASNLFNNLATTSGPLGAAACAVNIGARIVPIAAFLIGNIIYVYSPDNNTWMQFSYITPVEFVQAPLVLLDVFTNTLSNTTIQREPLLALVFYGKTQVSPPLFETIAFTLEEGMVNSFSVTPQVTFPQEEMLFGRDVVINSLYFSMNAAASLPNNTCVLSFYFNGVLFATYDLNTVQWNSLSGNPIEVTLYPSSMNVFTTHSPQLQIVANTRNGMEVRFSKIQIYASMEPEQRPVS